MAIPCRTCTHPERERIEVALAMTHPRRGGGVQRIADKWGVPRSSLRRHLNNHMTREQVMRLRAGMPDTIDVSIEEFVRQAGEGAIITLSRLEKGFRIRAEALEKIGDYEGSRKELAEAAKVARDLVLYAGLVPGRKTVNNNTLVLGDIGALFDRIDAALASYPDARQAVAEVFAQRSPVLPVLEHVR